MQNTQIIAIANQKGGVGKTTTSINLGTSLARHGKKVLIVDLDPQANSTMCMGFQNPDELPFTITNVYDEYINDNVTLSKEDYILQNEGCDLIPSSIQLAGIEPSLMNAMSRENILKCILQDFQKQYDYILIDCMPSLGMLTINALVAATHVLIPVQAHYLSAKGLEMLISTISKVKRKINPNIEFMGILLTMYNERLKFTKAIMSQLEKAYGSHINIFENKIPHSVKAVEHTSTGNSIFIHDPKCKVSLAYEAFANEVMNNG